VTYFVPISYNRKIVSCAETRARAAPVLAAAWLGVIFLLDRWALRHTAGATERLPGNDGRGLCGTFSCIVIPKFESRMENNTVAPLKSMSVAKLTDLKSKVEAAIAEKVMARRSELEMELSKLERHAPGHAKGRGRGGGKRGPVAPKYRNPKDPSQTWAGRGLQPLWMRDAIKSGKKLNSFLIK
jgi:DNA-binding protein H-NS